MAIPICRDYFDRVVARLERALKMGNNEVMARIDSLEKNSRYTSKQVEDFLKAQKKEEKNA